MSIQRSGFRALTGRDPLAGDTGRTGHENFALIPRPVLLEKSNFPPWYFTACSQKVNVLEAIPTTEKSRSIEGVDTFTTMVSLSRAVPIVTRPPVGVISTMPATACCNTVIRRAILALTQF